MPEVTRSSGATALPEPLRVETTRLRDGALVRLHGELDLATVGEAEAAIASSAITLADGVTVDLRGLEFIDSAGVSLLVRMSRDAHNSGSRLTVFAHPGPITRLLRLCALDRQLALVEDREALL